MIKNKGKQVVTVAGHPFAQIGVGTHIRSVHSSLQAAHIRSALFDIYGTDVTPAGQGYDELMLFGTARFDTPVNIFCLNGDEIEPALRHREIGDVGELGAFNIAYPMWELPNYPSKWVEQLARFDEVWAPSLFVEEALKRELGDKVRHMPIACEVRARSLRSRGSFGIPDDPFAFLTSFDFSSYMARKNPFAAIRAFHKMRDRVRDDVSLVIKVQNGVNRPDDYQEFRNEIRAISDSVVLIDETLTTDDMLTLISLCDAYLSLHRSEGFGLGMAEAMNLGRPPVCTAWSGNMDFCDERSAQLVNYQLISVLPGEYPCYEGQVWADPDVDDAAEKMAELVDNTALYAEKRLEGRIRMRTDFSYLATGIRYARRIREILNEQTELVPNWGSSILANEPLSRAGTYKQGPLAVGL